MTPREQLKQAFDRCLDSVDETIAQAAADYDALLKRLADRPTNQPSDADQAELKTIRRAMAGVVEAGRTQDAKQAFAELDAEFAEPPPTEVAMRLIRPTEKTGYWTWECCLAGLYMAVSQREPCRYCRIENEARRDGDLWLAEVGKQLGIKLVAKWEEKASKGETHDRP